MGVIALFFTSTGIVPKDLISWSILGDKILGVLANPYLIGLFVVALVAQFVDTSSPGITDKRS